MEENNNNEKTILDKGKEFAKKQIDNQMSKIFKDLLKKILPYVAQFFLILLLAGLILAIPQIIAETWKALLGTSKDAVANATSVYSSDFLEAAQQVHDEEMDWVYYTDHPLGSDSLAGTIQGALINKNQTTCCATYVSCVLYASGYFSAEEINQYNYNAAWQVDKLLNDYNWERIEGKENLQPGDIMVYKKRGEDGTIGVGHVDIYAGNDMFYNAGGTLPIQEAAPSLKLIGANWQEDPDIIEWWAYRLPASGPTNEPAERRLYNGQLIHINKKGAYKYNEKKLPEKLVEELQNQKVNNEAMGFVEEVNGSESTDENVSEKALKNLIKKYIEAEVKTTYPETKQSGNEIDGIIKVKRASAITGKTDQKLDYVNAEKFDEMLANGKSDIYNCFSLDPATFDLWIARPGSTTTYYDFNNNVIRTQGTEPSIVKEKIDYQELIENYSTPLNFFLTLHLVSQDIDFMKDFVDMVIGKSGDELIVLTYIDTYSESSIQNDYSGEDITKTAALDKDEIHAVENTAGTGDETPKEKEEKIDNSNIHKYINDIDYHKKITKTSYGKLYVTKVNSWLKSANKTITKYSSNSEPDVTDKIIVDKKKIPTKTDENTQTEGTIKIIQKITTTQKNTMFTIVDEDSKINVKKFIELIKKYPNVENNFKSAPSNIFYLLQQNENTQKIERIMRYVMYELNDVDYGITITQLQYLLEEEKQYFSSSQLLRDYIRCWEHSSPPPTNADGKCYIIETDGFGHPTVGYGVDIENSGYKQLFIDNGYPTHVGGEVPIEFVDSIEERIINEKIQSVKAMTTGLDLTSYQINALVSRAYNCGTHGALTALRGPESLDFVQSHQKYWNQERDDKFEEMDKNADFAHELYTNYMSKPNTSDGQYVYGLERRRKSEWTLFQTGYYDVLNKWHTSGDDIIVVADEIHKYMKANNYSYCVHEDNGKRGDECETFGRNHGLRSTFEASKTTKVTCCATYVSWVLQEAGFLENEKHTNGAASMVSTLRELGWVEIKSYNDLQPGDVLYYWRNGSDGISGIGHVDIYAGDDTKYNAGAGFIIRGAQPHKMNPADFYGALRAP